MAATKQLQAALADAVASGPAPLITLLQPNVRADNVPPHTSCVLGLDVLITLCNISRSLTLNELQYKMFCLNWARNEF